MPWRGWLRAHREGAVYQPREARGKAISAQDHDSTHPQVAVVVPAEYMFQDDTCDNVVGSRCQKRDLKLKEEMEAAGSPGKDSAKSKREGPERGGVQPAVRRRRGRPKKTERPSVAGTGPQAGEQGTAEMLQEVENQVPSDGGSRSRGLGPRRQRERGRVR